MKKKVSIILFLGTIFAVLLSFSPAFADLPVPPVPPLPPLIIPAPPQVVVIPNSYVYFPPDIDVDIFFFRGYWFRPHHGRWYRATSYRGPWVFVELNRVPGPVLHLSPGFRNIPPGHERIPYGQLKKNWKTWEREKRWDRRERREIKERHKEERKEHKRQGKGKGRD